VILHGAPVGSAGSLGCSIREGLNPEMGRLIKLNSFSAAVHLPLVSSSGVFKKTLANPPHDLLLLLVHGLALAL
jgi:hypothetical protein